MSPLPLPFVLGRWKHILHLCEVMLMVLVHPHGALSSGLSRLLIQLLPRLLLSFLFCLLAANLPAVAAQNPDDGQPPTGLSVLDAPARNSVLKAGDVTSVAIDVNAGTSGQGFTYNSLEVYLVSSQTNANVTVATGPEVLAQEPGSTVKHINWPVPTCLMSGDYNLTIYEASTFNGTGFFAIMPIPVRVQNDHPIDPVCTSSAHPLEAQPQPSSPRLWHSYQAKRVLPISLPLPRPLLLRKLGAVHLPQALIPLPPSHYLGPAHYHRQLR
ncbi:hypothetical protein C8Q80DRAFT_78878 [Daedaleopsis nitida]|nr:hypothetical protein C8Q80DRAFT_78878 [Daedaleopsis nitida]